MPVADKGNFIYAGNFHFSLRVLAAHLITAKRATNVTEELVKNKVDFLTLVLTITSMYKDEAHPKYINLKWKKLCVFFMHKIEI